MYIPGMVDRKRLLWVLILYENGIWSILENSEEKSDETDGLIKNGMELLLNLWCKKIWITCEVNI